MLLSNKHCQAF